MVSSNSSPPVVAKYRTDFMDQGLWTSLASSRHLRLPQWRKGPVPRDMERYLKLLGVSITTYYEYSGTKALREFGQMNPTWPLRAWVGLLLEAQENGYI